MEKTSAFLKLHNMHPDGIDMVRCCEALKAAMASGLKGQKSSLMMLPAYLNPGLELPNGKPTVVLDAGGTNLRAAQVTYLGGKAEIKGERVLPMPGTRGKLSWTEFLHQLAKITAPYAKEAACLGFCFSFPAEITPEIDGRILCFNKEVQVEGAEGKLVCRELVELLNREYGCAISHFALLNDTVATLLGGFGAQPYGKYDSYIGFILGTGMNCCYVEPEKSMIINMEAGGYAGFPRGTFDRVLDESSTNPGEHYFEKMVSGGYLGTVILETLRGACREGLFSKEFSQAVDAMSMDMAGISAYLDAPLGDAALAKACTSPTDTQRLWCVVDAALERAAKAVAVLLTAVMEQADCGKEPWKPACIVAEGSTFWKCHSLRNKIAYQMQCFAQRDRGRWSQFVSVENANLCGAAAAVLLTA